MRHLFATTVQVYRLVKTSNRGAASMQWVPLAHPYARFKCRLDLTFVRPGKDVLPPAEAGKAQDRVGVLICGNEAPIRASDRIKVISGPQQGTFEVRAIPDTAQDYGSAHHMEVQVIEVAQQVVTS